VICLHTVGRGCPDILVGWHGLNYLFEVKQPGGNLTPDEKVSLRAGKGKQILSFAWKMRLKSCERFRRNGSLPAHVG
jgi:hypothetical protein